MATYQGHDFGFFTFRKCRQNLVDCKTSEANDGPAKLLAGRFRHHQLGFRSFCEHAREIRRQHALTNFGDEPTAGKFPPRWRSGEGRVGEKGRFRWWPYHLKKKKKNM